MKVIKPLSIYDAKCSKCGDFIGLNHSSYRRERDKTGERFYHYPNCPNEPKPKSFLDEIKKAYNRLTD